MSSNSGFKERIRGGQKSWDMSGNEILYDYKNNLLYKKDYVWVVMRLLTYARLADPVDMIDSIWYKYDEAWDRVMELGYEGCLTRMKVK